MVIGDRIGNDGDNEKNYFRMLMWQWYKTRGMGIEMAWIEYFMCEYDLVDIVIRVNNNDLK